MPYTLKKNKLKVRDPETGNYQGTDVVAERSFDDYKSELETIGNNEEARVLSAGTTQVNAVTAAGAAARANFPETADATDTLAGDFAATFVPNKAYAVGDYCTYQYQLYRCNTTIAGNVDATFVSDHWDAVTITDTLNDEVDDLKKYLFVSDTASGPIVEFSDGADGLPLTSLSVGIEAVQAGSGDPSPENIRAIYGWTKTKIRRTAKNLWGGDAVLADVKAAVPAARVDAAARTVLFGASATVSHVILGGNYGVKFKENKQYTFIIKLTGNKDNIFVGYTDNTRSYFPQPNDEGVSKLVTTAGKTVLFLGKRNSGGSIILYADECGLFEGVVPEEEFEPYRGKEVAVDWETATGEVYGGTLNVLTGELTVTWGMKDLGDVPWIASATPYVGRFYTNEFSPTMDFSGSNDSGMLCSAYRPGKDTSVPSAVNNYQIMKFRSTVYINDLDYADKPASEFKEHVRGVQFAYKLKTPVAYQLTPAQMTTLLGENHIWADSGDVELGYMINTKSYIDEGDARGIEHTDASVLSAMKNIAEIPSGTSAPRSYAVGEFVIIDSVLYKVTSAIAIGETFQPGVNIAATTVGEELSAAHAEFVDREEKTAEELKIYAQIADRTYAGRDLTAVFASEIAQSGNDPWAWIKSRITAQNYEGIHVGDYIPWQDTTTAKRIRNARILGIDTYWQYGDTAVGHHIDFFGGLWTPNKSINKANYNNGTSESEHPWLASDAYLYANSLAGTVPSEANANPTLVDVDYTETGIYYYLPDNLKAQIKPKRSYLEKRYTAGELLTESFDGGWVDLGNIWFPTEYEVYGAPVWGGDKYACIGSAVQYPFFIGNMNRLAFGRTYWWLLTPSSINSTHWCYVTNRGGASTQYAGNNVIAAPICFRIT